MSGGIADCVWKGGIWRRIGWCVALGMCCALPMARAVGDELVLSTEPPAGAVILFDGQAVSGFVNSRGEASNWPVENGALVSTPNGKRSNILISRVHFRDAQVHLEFWLPPEGDGNSGVFLHGQYEIQILASNKNAELGVGDMGAVYGLHMPRINAARDRGQWQSLDVRYRAPRRNVEGSIIEDGTITARLNGKLIHNHAPVGERTSDYNPYRYDTTNYVAAIAERQRRKMTGPLILQDHDDPVRFRNVWILPLDEHAGLYDPASEQLAPIEVE